MEGADIFSCLGSAYNIVAQKQIKSILPAAVEVVVFDISSDRVVQVLHSTTFGSLAGSVQSIM
jgi:hypothetical protein